MSNKGFLKWPGIIFILDVVFGSVGDNSPFYINCVKLCNSQKCETGKHTTFDYNILGYGISLWSCIENCEYECQWKTVESFQRKKWSIPQFKGKWPFIRILCFQEPASVFFSVVNFFVVWKLLMLFRKKVSKSTKYYNVWNTFGLKHIFPSCFFFILGLLSVMQAILLMSCPNYSIGYNFMTKIHLLFQSLQIIQVQLNSWFWSSVYHSRDTDITERLDYMSAFLVILYSLYAMGLRLLTPTLNIRTFLWTAFCGSLALNHLAYLWLYHFDYGYNMKLSCVLGGCTIIGWFLWGFYHFQSQLYVWKIFLFDALVTVTTLLELLDFPPILWLIDAHALWHCSSILVNIVFFLFIIDDCNHIRYTSLEKEKDSNKTKEK